MSTPTVNRCRVRIVDDIQNRITVVESPRDRSLVYLDLAKLVHRVNRRRDETLRVSIHLLADIIILHWHSPRWYGDEFSKAILEAAQPFHEVEKLIWKGGPQA